MIYYSTKNIYLCDLAYLGAEVSGLDEQKDRQTVTVSWVGHEPYRLAVKASVRVQNDSVIGDF